MKGDINKIRFRRADNGKYFSTFDTKEEAFECIQEVARRYRYSGKHRNTIKALCEEYQEKGIMLYPTQLGRWLKDAFNLTISYTGYQRVGEKYTTYMSIDKEVADIRMQLNEKLGSTHLTNAWFNLWWRISFNLPIAEVFTFLEDEYGTTLVGFLEWKGEVRSVYVGKISQGSKKLLESLCEDCEQHGYEYLKQKCKARGFFTVGADEQ